MNLFERRTGRLHPVPEAHYLHEEIRSLLGRMASIEQNLRQVKALDNGEIRIASMPGPSVFVLPDLISRFVEARPGIRSTLVSRSSEAVIQLIAAQQYDVGVADYAVNRPLESSLVQAELIQRECICAIPANDPLCDKALITPADLDDRPMGTLNPEHETCINTREAFVQAGCELNVRFTTQYFIPLLTFVERQLACAIVDPLTRIGYGLYRGPDGGVQVRPFEPSVHYGIAIMTPAHRTPTLLARSFTQLLIEELGG